MLDFPTQAIITRDNVEINVHPMLLYRIVNPLRAVYETYDLCHAVEKLVQTTLRAIIGDMGLDDTLASREEINRSLSHKIHNVCLNWGISITKVELLEITPTNTVQAAMHQQLAAAAVSGPLHSGGHTSCRGRERPRAPCPRRAPLLWH